MKAVRAKKILSDPHCLVLDLVRWRICILYHAEFDALDGVEINPAGLSAGIPDRIELPGHHDPALPERGIKPHPTDHDRRLSMSHRLGQTIH